ncbi:hypothetical protein [Myroides odoratus]
MKNLKKELDFIELEERLEMVNLAQAAAHESICVGNNGCTPSK